MAIFSWDGSSNLDLKQLGESFDFRSDVLQISNPDLQAHQFDLVEIGTDLAIVLSRDVDGSPLAAGDVAYAYIPNMVIRQIGVDAGGSSQNVVMSNGGQLWVGGRDTDTVLDNQANVVELSSTSNSSQIWGLGGNDTIGTGSGDDRVYGNVSADSIDGGSGDDSLYGGQDSDTVSGGGGNDDVAGDLGADSLDGGSGDDIVYGGAGNDSIETGLGDDTVFAGADADSLMVNNSATGDKLVYMDNGQDVATIVGTTGDHFVYMGENNDTASLDANSGDVYVSGDGGNDSVVGQNSGSDTLDGGDDDDVLRIGHASIGDKTLIGGDGNDGIFIDDDSGNADIHIIPNTHVTVSGGGGADEIDYDRGLFITDANDGGAGNDTITFDSPTLLSLRDLSIQNVETVNFANAEDFDELDGDDEVVFADGNNTGTVTVNTRGGDDLMDATAETSSPYILNGQVGADELIGGGGADTLSGDEFHGEFDPKDPLTSFNVLDGNGVSLGDWMFDASNPFEFPNVDRMTGNGGADVFKLDFPSFLYEGLDPDAIRDFLEQNPDASTEEIWGLFAKLQINTGEPGEVEDAPRDIITDFTIGEDKIAIDSKLFGFGPANFINTWHGDALNEGHNVIVNSGDWFTNSSEWGGAGFLDEDGAGANLGAHPGIVVVMSDEQVGSMAAEVWYVSDLHAWVDGPPENVVTFAAPLAVLRNITTPGQLAQMSADDFTFY